MTMSSNQAPIDTIKVVNYCHLGSACPNHDHGIVDTTFYFYAKENTSKGYFKVMPEDVDVSVDCKNLYKDMFGNLFYMEPEVEQVTETAQEAKLTSFDTIKAGDKIFPAPTPFTPHYISHTQQSAPAENYDMVVDAASFPVLVLITIAYAYRAMSNNSWVKFIKELSAC